MKPNGLGKFALAIGACFYWWIYQFVWFVFGYTVFLVLVLLLLTQKPCL